MSTTQIILKEAWQVTRDDSHQRGNSTVKPAADEEKKELKIDRRNLGTPPAEVNSAKTAGFINSDLTASE